MGGQDQDAKAQAWAAVFQDGPAVTSVIEDMTSFVYSLPTDQIAGGARLLTYILWRRGQLRRQKEKAR